MKVSNLGTRRRFLRKFGGVSASLGALLAGIVPEVQSRTRRAMIDVPQTIADPQVPDVPLPPAEVNALYAAALNSPDAFALTQGFGESVRIDPPERSYEHIANGQRSAVILSPIKANHSGASVGYLYFGNMGTLNDSGAPHAVPVRLSISRTGSMQVALGGVVQAPSAPEAAEVLWAAHFPQEYVWHVSAQTPVESLSGTTRQTDQSSAVAPLGRAPEQAAEAQVGMRQPRRGPGGAPVGTPRRQCEDQLLTCLRGTVTPCAVGGVALVLCVVCGAACTMGTWGVACWACTVPCGTTIGFGTACMVILDSCRNQWKRCLRECRC